MLIVVGGHARNLGTSAVVAGLIRRFRDRRWIALRVTQTTGGLCTATGNSCDCPDGGDAEHPYTLDEEFEPGGAECGRYLTAGAARSLWLRTPSGGLGGAAPRIAKLLAEGGNVIVEAHRPVDLPPPDLRLALLDFACEEFDPASVRLWDWADSYLMVDRGVNMPLWEHLARGRWDRKPRFEVVPPRYVTPKVAAFVAERLAPQNSGVSS